MITAISPKLVLSLILFAFALSRPTLCSAFEPPGTAEAAAVGRANTRIERIYKQLMSQLAPQQQVKLRDEQRAWIKWRDQEAARLAGGGGAGGGSAYRVDYANGQLKLIRQRTDVLRHRLKTAKRQKT
jgi:uncharacterized protein YecT (DUF1311 family)